jgi:hypothetical protein
MEITSVKYAPYFESVVLVTRRKPLQTLPSLPNGAAQAEMVGDGLCCVSFSRFLVNVVCNVPDSCNDFTSSCSKEAGTQQFIP